MNFRIIRLLACTRPSLKRNFSSSIDGKNFAWSVIPGIHKASPVHSSFKIFFSVHAEEKLRSYICSQDGEIQSTLSQHMTVYPEFISEEEEESMLAEVESHMKRMRYQFDHWDNAIHGYRETEKKNWNASNQKVLERVKETAFVKNVTPLAYVHVLDIAKEGYIKPHIDAVRFCGDTITGLCIMSSCVMRLALESDASKFGDVLLPRRCLYIMRGAARYDFTHEVLKDEESFFNNQHVPRDRRVSVICRNEPRHEDTL